MKRTFGVAMVVLAAWWWHRSPRIDEPHRAAQAAVTDSGFALVHQLDGDWRRVREIRRDGALADEHLVHQLGELRVVGTRAGTAMGWVEGKRLILALVGDDTVRSSWGKDVRTICDGAATSGDRFGIGWLELDHSVWMVHGDTATIAAAEPAMQVTARAEWCGIASAGDNIALISRERDRLAYTLCSKTRCSSTSTTTAFDRRFAMLGFACLRDACAFASRDASGNTRLSYVVGSGAVKWSTPIDTGASRIAITAVGDRAFAVGWQGADGAEVIRLDRKGVRVPIWHGPAAIPALAWDDNTLVIAVDVDGKPMHTVLELN